MCVFLSLNIAIWRYDHYIIRFVSELHVCTRMYLSVYNRTARAAARLARLSSAGKLFRQRGNQLSAESNLQQEEYGMDMVDRLDDVMSANNDGSSQQTEAKIMSDRMNSLISARFLLFSILIILVVGIIGSQVRVYVYVYVRTSGVR